VHDTFAPYKPNNPPATSPRLSDAAQRQINVNRLLLERQKRYLEHSRQKILARHAKRMGGQQPPRGAAPFPSRATHLYDV